MEANGNVIRDHGIGSSVDAWNQAKDWLGSHLTRDRMVEGALAAATSGMLGFVLYVLHHAMQQYTVTGF
ncbi:MAG: hypothetical protein AB1640_05455 [bacterium]